MKIYVQFALLAKRLRKLVDQWVIFPSWTCFPYNRRCH